MEVIFPEEFKKFDKEKIRDKSILLKRFKEEGFFLIDSSDDPINQLRKEKDGKKKIGDIILRNSSRLIEKIKKIKNNKTKIILIQLNIFDLLNDPLRNEGFNILNKKGLYPPYRKWVDQFKTGLKEILSENKIFPYETN